MDAPAESVAVRIAIPIANEAVAADKFAYTRKENGANHRSLSVLIRVGSRIFHE